MGFIEVNKTKVSAGLHSFGNSKKESISLSFPDSGDHPHSLAHDLPSSQPAIIGSVLSTMNHSDFCSIIMSLFLTLTPLLPASFSFKDSCDYIGPTQITKDNLLILRPVDQ